MFFSNTNRRVRTRLLWCTVSKNALTGPRPSGGSGVTSVIPQGGANLWARDRRVSTLSTEQLILGKRKKLKSSARNGKSFQWNFKRASRCSPGRIRSFTADPNKYPNQVRSFTVHCYYLFIQVFTGYYYFFDIFDLKIKFYGVRYTEKVKSYEIVCGFSKGTALEIVPLFVHLSAPVCIILKI